MTKKSAPRQDVYTRITSKIIADLEQGVRPWMMPWNAEHAAGRITGPSRHNGQPYNGINILMLWSAAVSQGYAAPIWMTYRQASELGAHVRKGEKGELVVYANTITRTDIDAGTGEEAEQTIPFLIRLHRLQRRADRRASGALLSDGRAGPGPGGAH